MFQKVLCLILLFKLCEARYGFVPKFYGQDSAVIVDTDKPLPQTNQQPFRNYPSNKLRLAPPFPLWRHYPRYHIIPPPPPGQILSINTWSKSQNKPVQISKTTTTSSTTTTTTTPKPTTTTPKPTTTTAQPTTISPFITDDEFPKELLDIAQNKLGLKSLDEIPSISELGQLLGTNTPEETLNYIRQLTSNEQGVALVKAYIESSDYTDSTGDLNNKNYDSAEDENESLKINDEGLIVITDEDSNDDYEIQNEEDEDSTPTTLKPRKVSKIINRLKQLPAAKPGFMERVVNYMHLNNLFHKTEIKDDEKPTNEKTEKTNYNELNRNTEMGKKITMKGLDEEENYDAENENTNDIDDKETLVLVKEPIPFNYPVPLRAESSTTTTTTTTTTPSPPVSLPSETVTVVHLNTPKILLPHVQHIARVTKISPKKIEDFLASKPKLLELATKVSRFPIGYDRKSPMEAQVMAAVQRAIEQDDDLKKLLSSAATLK